MKDLMMKKRLIYILIILAILTYGIYTYLPLGLSKYRTYLTYKNLNLKVKKIKYDNDFF